jgi:hypothetical protein
MSAFQIVAITSPHLLTFTLKSTRPSPVGEGQCNVVAAALHV